jgi:L-asparagine transporter-like permease
LSTEIQEETVKDELLERESGLKRHLKKSQLTMIAMGGAIGTGLFLGSGFAVEVIAVTAGETTDPGTSVPKAMKAMVFRLSSFYILAIALIVMMVPWTKAGIGQSPFVTVFAPKVFGKLTKQGSPRNAILVSTIGLIAAAILKGARKQKEMDISGIADTIKKVYEIISSGGVSEIDLNPIIVSDKDATVVDALIFKE